MKMIAALFLSASLAFSMLGCDSRTPEERAIDEVNDIIMYEGESDDDIACKSVEMKDGEIDVVHLEKPGGAEFEQSVSLEISGDLLDMQTAMFILFSQKSSIRYVDYTLKYNDTQVMYLKMDAETHKYLDDSEQMTLMGGTNEMAAIALYDDYKLDNTLLAVYNAGISNSSSIKDCYGIPEGEQ